MRIYLSFFLGTLFSCSAFSDSHPVFHCEASFPKNLQVPALEQCNQNVIIIPPKVRDERKLPYFKVYLTDQILKNNNTGASIIMLPNHQKKIVYRSAMLAGSPLCIYELFAKRHVNTIINLLDTTTAHGPVLTSLEESVFHSIGGRWYSHALNFRVSPKITTVNDDLFNLITEIVKQVVQSKGNVLIHCTAGEHDTSVIFGVLQKCYNKLPLDVIKADVLCHMGPLDYPYLREAYKLVAQAIDEYPCRLLQA